MFYYSRFDRNFESNNMKQLRKQLDQAENRILVLEAKAKYAEEESLRKAEEVCLHFLDPICEALSLYKKGKSKLETLKWSSQIFLVKGKQFRKAIISWDSQLK